MTDAPRTSFGQAALASLGAGIASSLLIAVLQPQSIFGGLLFLIAPLPLVIAGFSYHPLVAALAALFGCLFLDLVVMPGFSVAYALIAGLPSWLICEAGTRRGRTLMAAREADGFVTPGAILFGIAAYASLLILAVSLYLSTSYEALRALLYTAFEQTMRQQYETGGSGLTLPDGTNLEPLGRLYARVMPALMALPLVLMAAVSGYLGVRIARISERLMRPWPDFRRIRLPRIAAPALGLSLVLIAIGGYPGLFGETLLLALVLCFSLQGLAVIHWQIRERRTLRWLISASWALIILFPVSAIGFALIGLADHFLDLRKLRGSPPPANA